MGKRNQARKAAQAKKSARVEKRSAPAKSSGGGGGGGGRQSSAPAPASSNNSSRSSAASAPRRPEPRTANQLRKRVERQEAAGRSTTAAQAKLDKISANRKAARNTSYKSQGEISGVSDFDFSKRGKDTVEKGELSYLKKQGFDKGDIAKHVNESGMRIRKGAQQKLDRWASAKEKAQVVKENPVAKEPAVEKAQVVPNPSANANVNKEPVSVPVYKPITISPAEELLNPGQNISVGGTENGTPSTNTNQSQDQAVSQDNDISSNVTGDNNNVNISQDNSVRQYGGINKSFVYNGSSNGNNYMDTPVSAGTIGGYFHDEDSPGRSASFMDRYATMNSDYQKQFQNTNFAAQSISKAAQNKAVDIGAIDQRVDERAKANRARSSSMAGDIFGDMFNYQPEEFTSAKPDEEDD